MLTAKFGILLGGGGRGGDVFNILLDGVGGSVLFLTVDGKRKPSKLSVEMLEDLRERLLADDEDHRERDGLAVADLVAPATPPLPLRLK